MNLSENKKALFDYEILEKMEAGLVLAGYETKSVKAGQASLKGSFVTFHGKDAYVTNMHISRYKPAGPMPDYEPEKSRRLLLHKKEISYLRGKSQEKGLTIVPIRVYTKNRFVKIELAIARGKKHYDKRETLKKRAVEREIKRTLKND